METGDVADKSKGGRRATPRRDYGLKTINKAVRVLSLFCGGSLELGVTEVANRLGLSKSVAHRLLLSLKASNLLEQDEETSKYRLGMKAFEIGMAYRRGLSWDRIATPLLGELAMKYGENVHLAVLDGFEIIYIRTVQGTKPIRVIHQVGERNFAHSTALGKAMLAFLPEEELEALFKTDRLPKLTENTITSPEELRIELQRTCLQGYARDVGESGVGIGCIAAPIMDDTGRVRAAVSISGLCEQIFGEREEELSTAIIETAKAISERLGYQDL